MQEYKLRSRSRKSCAIFVPVYRAYSVSNHLSAEKTRLDIFDKFIFMGNVCQENFLQISPPISVQFFYYTLYLDINAAVFPGLPNLKLDTFNDVYFKVFSVEIPTDFMITSRPNDYMTKAFATLFRSGKPACKLKHIFHSWRTRNRFHRQTAFGAKDNLNPKYPGGPRLALALLVGRHRTLSSLKHSLVPASFGPPQC